MKLMGNFHVVSLLHLLFCHMPVATQTTLVNPFISKKISGKQLPGFGMTMNTGNVVRMELRWCPHGDAGLPGMT
jgi:hypothetical protein